MLPAMTKAETKIRELAKRHGVTFTPTAHDTWLKQIARLSAAGVEPDRVASLVIALKRDGVVTAAQGNDLYLDHIAGR